MKRAVIWIAARFVFMSNKSGIGARNSKRRKAYLRGQAVSDESVFRKIVRGPAKSPRLKPIKS